MQELLNLVEEKINTGDFISLIFHDVDKYTVNYWEPEIAINELGEEVQIRAGKQQVFTL